MNQYLYFIINFNELSIVFELKKRLKIKTSY